MADGASRPGGEAPSLSAKAVALAQDVLRLHEEYERQIAECKIELKELLSQVDSLTTHNRSLELELADLKRGQRPEASRQGYKDLLERNSQLEKEVAQLKETLEKQEVAQLKGTDDSKAALVLAEGTRAGGKAEQQTPEQSNVLTFNTFNTDSIFLQEKGQFIEFVLAVANNGKESKEYRQMYHFLLKCFTDADNNFDGRVGYLEFETLIDAAAFLPRRFGYAPSTPELYSTDFDRVRQRLQLFNGLKPKKAKALNKQSGTYDYISFDTWLRYAISHIKEKSELLKNESPHSKLLGTKEEFQWFILQAVGSRRSQEYKELYHYVLKRFVDADTDMDGLIDSQSFMKLTDVSTYPARMRGFVPDSSSEYSSEEEKREAREMIFKQVDTDGSGYIGFDAWLEFFYTNFCKTAANLGCAGTVPDVEIGGTSLAEPKCPWRV